MISVRGARRNLVVTAAAPQHGRGGNRKTSTSSGGGQKKGKESPSRSSTKRSSKRRSIASKYRIGNPSSDERKTATVPGRLHFPAQAEGKSQSQAGACDIVTCELLVLGSGVAGLTCALEAADLGVEVVVVTKSDVMEGSTKYAQGGVAAVMTSQPKGGDKEKEGPRASSPLLKEIETKLKDSVNLHVEDTMNAGCYLNNRNAVEIMCREGPSQVKMLRKIGVPFTMVDQTTKSGVNRDPPSPTPPPAGGSKLARASASEEADERQKKKAKLHLGKEGGHSRSRVVHAADATGAAMMKALVDRVRAHENIEIRENVFALDLLVLPLQHNPSAGSEGTLSTEDTESAEQRGCYGCDAIDLTTGTYQRFVSKSTVVATGGCGQIYPETTNPHVATGDGIAMAARAGAKVENMEFIQFHPTSLFVEVSENVDGDTNQVFLISEAVRGAGAVLRNAKGETFMDLYDPRADLAPRDIVARGIYDQMRRHETAHVYLDATHLTKSECQREFPHISSHVYATLGIDMSQDWIPVVPAQHYTCGGILTSTNGETNVKGLYAIGEAACTGVHGANRLASNSLLEGLVFGKRSVVKSMKYMEEVVEEALLAAEHVQISSLTFAMNDGSPRDCDLSPGGDIESLISSMQNLMWKHAGILRNDRDLKRGLQKVKRMRRRLLEDLEVSNTLCNGVKHAELINMVTVGELVLEGATKREVSAGLHWNVDRPEQRVEKKPVKETVVEEAQERKARVVQARE